MEKKTFTVNIAAPQSIVWEVLWGDDTYPAWTRLFAEGSSAETDWQKGSKVVFGDGKGNGMVSRIHDVVVNSYMGFEHLGEIVGGVEDTTSEKVQKWAGAMEEYTLTAAEGGTLLTVTLDIDAEFADYFVNTFPKALALVKELAEAKS